MTRARRELVTTPWGSLATHELAERKLTNLNDARARRAANLRVQVSENVKRGLAHYNAGRWADADREFAEAMRLLPDDRDTLQAFGWDRDVQRTLRDARARCAASEHGSGGQSWQPKSFFASDRERSEYYAQQNENWKAHKERMYVNSSS